MLDPQDLGQWQSDGHWTSGVVFGTARLECLRDHFDRLFQGQYDLGGQPMVDPHHRRGDVRSIQNIDNAHWADSAFRDLARDETIGAIAADLLGVYTVRLWASQALVKPGAGAEGGEVGWHQDMTFWQCAHPADLLTAWLPLEDVDETNGCLQFVPGSHRWGLTSEQYFFSRPSASQLSALAGESGSQVVQKCPMAAGQVSFHHCLTLHASGPNYRQRPRRAISIHLMAGHVAYKSGSSCDLHVNARLLRGRDGYPYSGDFFPVIYAR